MKISFKFVCLVYDVGSVWDWEFSDVHRDRHHRQSQTGRPNGCPCQSAFADLATEQRLLFGV